MFLSKCLHCERKLLMEGRRGKKKAYSCSECVPKNSSARDDINETYKYEIFCFKAKEGEVLK